MPVFSKIKENPKAWLTLGFIVVAAAAGSYYILDKEVPAGTEPVAAEVDEAEIELVDVGWWNIRDFSTSSRDDSEMTVIARIIETDVMVIGELNDTLALKELVKKKGLSWDWAATHKKIGRSGHSAEFYGFIWNADKLNLVSPVNIYNDSLDIFDREPAWATFRTVNGGLDFTLICVHITWGSSGVGPRKEEVKAMKPVWLAVQEATLEDNDIITLGDFNRNKNGASFDSLLAIPGVIRANEDTGPTHISGNSTYDQIFIDTTFTKEWTGEFNTGLFDETVFGNDDDKAKKVVSDHRPVWIRLYVPEKDDD